MFKTALHGEKVVHIYWHTSAFSLRLRLSHAMHAITSNIWDNIGRNKLSNAVAQSNGASSGLSRAAKELENVNVEHDDDGFKCVYLCVFILFPLAFY